MTATISDDDFSGCCIFIMHLLSVGRFVQTRSIEGERECVWCMATAMATTRYYWVHFALCTRRRWSKCRSASRPTMARGNTAWPSNNNGVTWRRAKDCCRCRCRWRWQQRGRRRISISWSLTSFSFCFDHTISLLSKEIVGSSSGHYHGRRRISISWSWTSL